MSNELAKKQRNARAVEIATEVDPQCGGYFRSCLQRAALLGMEYEPHDAIKRLEAEKRELLAALKPFAAFAEQAEQFVEARAKDGGLPNLSTNSFRLSDFQRARSTLAKAGGAS